MLVIILPQVEAIQKDLNYSLVTEEAYQDMPLTSQGGQGLFTKSLNAQGWNRKHCNIHLLYRNEV